MRLALDSEMVPLAISYFSAVISRVFFVNLLNMLVTSGAEPDLLTEY